MLHISWRERSSKMSKLSSGVTITNDLRWNTHVSNICTKANRTLGFLRRKGKEKSPGRATSRSRSQPTTPGGKEKVTQINVCIANKQTHDTHKDQLPLPQAR